MFHSTVCTYTHIFLCTAFAIVEIIIMMILPAMPYIYTHGSSKLCMWLCIAIGEAVACMCLYSQKYMKSDCSMESHTCHAPWASVTHTHTHAHTHIHSYIHTNTHFHIHTHMHIIYCIIPIVVHYSSHYMHALLSYCSIHYACSTNWLCYT